MKIAQIQTNPVLGNNVENVKAIEHFLDKCVGSDIIILPELANSGYNFGSKDKAAIYANQNNHNIFIEFLKTKSALLNAAIISGYFEICGDKFYNSSVLVNPSGEVCNYRKVHLFMNEKNIFDPGNLGFPVTEYKGVKIGMLICFDYLFPEAWRIMALKGADIVAHPSNLVTFNARKVVPAQAVINRYFVATTNRIGNENGIIFNGNSTLYNPYGDVVASIGDSETGVIFSDINPMEARNKMITNLNHVINDRRLDAYSGLI